MAGHSKWKQIKHKKAVTDTKKGKLFSKIVREIMVAVRAGGTSEDTNIRLRTAIERGRANGLPKENTERAIERASGAGEEGKLQEFLYEATAPGGIAILVEGITDNKNRSLAEIKHILADHGARIADQGSLVWNFDKVGTLEAYREQNGNISPEDIELAFIDAGARDFQKTDAGWLVETEFSDREKVRAALESKKIVVSAASHEYKPKTPLPQPAGQELESLFDALLEHDDVQEIYTNIENSGA